MTLLVYICGGPIEYSALVKLPSCGTFDANGPICQSANHDHGLPKYATALAMSFFSLVVMNITMAFPICIIQ